MNFETKRFLCRPLDDIDQAAFVNLYQDPKVMRKIASPLSEEQATKRFKATLALNRKTANIQRFWAVEDKREGTCKGFVMLKWNGSSGLKTEIGIMLQQKANGGRSGYEIVEGLIQCAFEDFSVKSVVAYVDASHLAARKILLEAGFIGEHDSKNEKMMCYTLGA